VKKILPLLALILLAVSVRGGPQTDSFRDGDIIFQTSRFRRWPAPSIMKTFDFVK